MRRLIPALAVAAAALAFGVVVMGCDDDGGLIPMDRTPASGDPASPEAFETAQIPPGTPPALSAPIEVALREWEISAVPAAVRAGTIFFLVDNAGAESAHSFVVIRSDLAPDELPVADGRPALDELEVIGSVGPIELETSGSLTLDLIDGRYVLICDIAGGDGASHYERGMTTGFVVQ